MALLLCRQPLFVQHVLSINELVLETDLLLQLLPLRFSLIATHLVPAVKVPLEPLQETTQKR